MDQQDLNRKLRCAAKFGREEECIALLKQGADVASADPMGSTALHNAIRRGNLAVCVLIWDHDPSLASQALGKLKPLQFAVYHGQKAIVDYLVDTHGATLDEITFAGETLDQLAARCSQTRMVSHLMMRRSEQTMCGISNSMDAGTYPADSLTSPARRSNSLSL
jgi:ankyrin repeat protein